jgi:hypothetical protein
LKLPLWRLLCGVAIFAGLAAVLLALTPVTFENFRLGRYVRTLGATTTPDEVLRSEILARARDLHLPVQAGDIGIAHPGGRLQLSVNYRVHMDLVVYPVDLHFHQDLRR